MRIIYIDVDCLRPDHTTPYGYQRNLTPNLQKVADRGVVFDQYHSSDTPCVPSRGAFTTQRFGIESGAIGHQGHDGDMRLTESRSHRPDAPYFGFHLANEGGFHTVGMSCFAERHQAWWFHSNFMEFIRPSLSLGLDEDAAEVTDCAIEWLGRRGGEDDWFLAINYWDPHADYMIPPEWADKAADSGPAPAWPDEDTIKAHQTMYGGHTAADLHGVKGEKSAVALMPDAIRNRADFEKLVNGYDGAIAYWDHHFGRLMQALDDMGIANDTAVIVTADHGEAFGEHGVYAEHAMAHPATNRVPLIVYWPGLTEDLPESARRHSGLQYHLDLGPTICDLLDLPTPTGWHGRSFAPVLRGEQQPGRDYLVLTQGVHTFQRAVRMGDLLYLRTLHPGTYRVDPEELYDVAADPYLTENLMQTAPERAEPLRSALAQWWYEHAGQPGSEPDPLQGAVHRGPVLYYDPLVYLDHLEATGRADLAADSRARLGRAVPAPEGIPDHEKPKRVPRGKRSAVPAE